MNDPIIGKDAHFDTASKKFIALFAAEMTCMIDVDHPETCAISQIERSYIYQNRCPPPNWAVFVGRTISSDWHFRRCHHGIRSSIKRGETISQPAYRGQITTVGLGNLLLHAVSHQDVNLIDDPGIYARKLGIHVLNENSDDFSFYELEPLTDGRTFDVAHQLEIDLVTKRN